MPVRLCFRCRFHLDSTDNSVFCGFDCSGIGHFPILRGTKPIRDFIPYCPILIPARKTDYQYRSKLSHN